MTDSDPTAERTTAFGNCPRCGTPVEGVSTDEPLCEQLSPCGHTVPTSSDGRVVEDISSEWPDADGAWRVRDADEDDAALVTDGGRDLFEEWHSLTGFRRDILRVLGEEGRYGLAIKRQLEAWYGTEVNHGRLYPNLDDLVNKGLVEKTELDRRTNKYGLTDDGVRMVAMAARRDVDLDLDSLDRPADEEATEEEETADRARADGGVSDDD